MNELINLNKKVPEIINSSTFFDLQLAATCNRITLSSYKSRLYESFASFRAEHIPRFLGRSKQTEPNSKPAVNRQPGFRREASSSRQASVNFQRYLLIEFQKKKIFSKRMLKIMKIMKFSKTSLLLDISLSSSK